MAKVGVKGLNLAEPQRHQRQRFMSLHSYSPSQSVRVRHCII